MSSYHHAKAAVFSPFHLLVFFTYGNCLGTWADAGLLSRELLLYKKMVARGNRVTLLTYGTNRDYQYARELEGIDVIPVYALFKKSKNKWINFFKSFLFIFHPRLKGVIKDVDVIKTNQMFGAWLAILAAKFYQKPLVVRCGYEMLRNMTRGERKLLKRLANFFWGYLLELAAYLSANQIIISSESDCQFIHRIFPVNKCKISVIRNFIDTDQFQADLMESNARIDKRLLFVGRLEPCKNLESLIKAAEMAGWQLDIIGKGVLEGPLKAMAENHKYHVKFLGLFENKEIPSVIKKYQFYILPSFFECSPKSLLEAMSCQRVVIGTDVDGIKEVIRDGESGFLCKTDSLSICQTLHKIFNMPEDMLVKIGCKARQFVVGQSSLDSVYKKEMNIYNQLLS